MRLNLPIFDQLSACHNLLIAGMGGGFDIFCGLPLYFELRQRGQSAHLANYSFSEVSLIRDGTRLTPSLVGVDAGCQTFLPYFPEKYLAQWFKAMHNDPVAVWCFEKTGVKPLLEGYRALVRHLNIDGILLIDGGVDSLMRGDEANTGTLIEDAISLHVVNELHEVPVRMLACLGFGAEDGVTYAHVFENIAALTEQGAFLGACSLTPQMEAYQFYEEAVLYTQAEPMQDASVINSSIISAVCGHFGNYHLTRKTAGSRLWISPLMPLYWFFDLSAVARRNLYLSQLASSVTFRDALQMFIEVRRLLPGRAQRNVPL
jgi:hypothetical protein